MDMVGSLNSSYPWGEVITGLWGCCSCSVISSGWQFHWSVSENSQSCTRVRDALFWLYNYPKKVLKWTLVHDSRASLMCYFVFLLIVGWNPWFHLKLQYQYILFSNAPRKQRGEMCFKLDGLNKLSLIYL